MLDSVLGEPWPADDGKFGMCVWQGAGSVHASSVSPNGELLIQLAGV